MNKKVKPAAPIVAPLPIKIVFWLLLGAMSVIFAEVVSGSAPYPFFDPSGWGQLVTYPLYTLHTLVLAALIFRKGRVSLVILFLAGAIFGLYEAYVTKVLWSPTWGDTTMTFAGVHVVQTAVLVLFWHPFMGFILPLMAGERFFTISREVLDTLPARLRDNNRWLLIGVGIFALYCGIVEASNAPDITASLTSIAGAGLVFGVLAAICYRFCREYPLRALLPAKREAIVLAVLLAISYVWQTLLIRPEAFPISLLPHLIIWLMYALFGVLLYFNLKKAPTYKASTLDAALSGAWRVLLLFWAVFLVSAAIFVFAKPFDGMVVLVSWALGVLLGVLLTLRAAVVAYRGRREKAK